MSFSTESGDNLFLSGVFTFPPVLKRHPLSTKEGRELQYLDASPLNVGRREEFIIEGDQ